MIKKLSNSLIAQLIAFAMAILIFMLGSFIVTNCYASSVIKENTLELNNKILTQVNSKMNEFYSSMEHVAAALAYTPNTYNYFTQTPLERVVSMENLSSVFSNTILLEENIVGIYLYDTDMVRIASMGREAEKEQPVAGLMNEMGIGNLFYLKQAGVPYYIIYYPVYDIKNRQYGKQIGMCVLVMKTDNFHTLLEGAQATPHTQVYLVDGNGTIVAAEGNKEAYMLEEVMEKNMDGYYTQRQELGTKGWKIISFIPKNELSSNADGLKEFIAAAYVLSIVLMGLMVYFFYRHMVQPMHLIARFIQNIVTVPDRRMKVNRQDELGAVITSLNQMLDDKERLNLEIQLSQKRTYEAELAKTQLQILAYRNQINPHFLYNTFESIRAMALYYEAEDIAEITMALSRVFKFAVKGDNAVHLSEEVNYVREYAKIIDYRFMGKIKVKIEMEKELCDNFIIKLILQPLVENSVFHGLEQKIESGEVRVSISAANGNRIRLVVEDNGLGIKPEKLAVIRETLKSGEKGNGIGLANIYQRLKLFYGDTVSFDIQSEWGKWTRVEMILPDDVPERSEKYV